MACRLRIPVMCDRLVVIWWFSCCLWLAVVVCLIGYFLVMVCCYCLFLVGLRLLCCFVLLLFALCGVGLVGLCFVFNDCLGLRMWCGLIASVVAFAVGFFVS